VKLLSAMQNSLPSGSCMTVHRWLLKRWLPTTLAPSLTNLSIADGSESTKSTWTRFFARLISATLLKWTFALSR